MVSDEYIRMSKEAMELQEQWEPKPGDMYARKNLAPFVIHGEFAVDKTNYTWLPRQEDLIKIMENNWEHGRCELIGHLHNFSWNYIHDRCEKYDFNELWLMVLMEYIYNKRWDGNGWVKL